MFEPTRYLKGLFFALFSPITFAMTIPNPPSIDATSYIVIDFNTSKALAEKDADKRLDPASITKLMTVYVVDKELKNGRLSLEDSVPVSQKAWKAEGSRMFIQAGKQVTVDELLKGIIIQSGNDASIALAEYVAGSEEAFADLMNQYAKKLGMTNSHFSNATGIPDDNHYSTARDLSILSQALIREFPESYELYSEKWFTYNGIKQPNRNRLLWREPYVDGIKTGHSSTAGYCLAASAKKDNMRLISVVLGSANDNSRNEQTQQLLRYGFRFFETHRLYQSGQSIENMRIWMGTQKNITLGTEHDLYITIPQGQYKNLDAKIHIDQSLYAPITKGAVQGKLTVRLGDELIAETPVISLEGVNKGDLWTRMQDYISLGIHKVLKPKEA